MLISEILKDVTDDLQVSGISVTKVNSNGEVERIDPKDFYDEKIEEGFDNAIVDLTEFIEETKEPVYYMPTKEEIEKERELNDPAIARKKLMLDDSILCCGKCVRGINQSANPIANMVYCKYDGIMVRFQQPVEHCPHFSFAKNRKNIYMEG